MFANSQMMGVDLGLPDVCLTPTPAPVPVPYPNIAAGPMGVPAVYNVLFMAAPAHNLATTIPLTNGDNAGVAMGVASGTVMGPSRHLTGAFSVLAGCFGSVTRRHPLGPRGRRSESRGRRRSPRPGRGGRGALAPER